MLNRLLERHLPVSGHTRLRSLKQTLTAPRFHGFRSALERIAATNPSDAAARAACRLAEMDDRPEESWDPDNLLHQLAVRHLPTKRTMGYIKRYWPHFAPIREQVKRVLEIGVQTPNSLMMWQEFFPNAMIYGIDIDEACRTVSGGRRQVFIGDQKDEPFLRSVVTAAGPFDIVIDDGEHTEFLYTFKDAPWLARNVVGLHFYRHLILVERGFNPDDNPYLKPRPLRNA